MVKKEVNEMSFLDHLETLRWHLIRAIVAVKLGISVIIRDSISNDNIIIGIIKLILIFRNSLIYLRCKIFLHCCNYAPFDISYQRYY